MNSTFQKERGTFRETVEDIMDFADHELHQVQQKGLGKEWRVGPSSGELESN